MSYVFNVSQTLHGASRTNETRVGAASHRATPDLQHVGKRNANGPPSVSLSKYLLRRWMNARKVTIEHLSVTAGVPAHTICQALEGRIEPNTSHRDLATTLARALALADDALLDAEDEIPAIIFQSAEDTRRTRRPMRRDGIHFYNYYTLPAPTNAVAPVILDILCPAGVLPSLNNGHLEPAITVNLGPGAIWGRWAEELSEQSWRRLEADASDWIVGDSYIESAYRPHTYALASRVPSRIVSYTVGSSLEPLVRAARTWRPAHVSALVASVEKAVRSIRGSRQIERRLHDVHTLASAVGMSVDVLVALLAAPAHRVDLAGIMRVARALDVDYRCLLPSDGALDSLGKRFLSREEAAATERRFASYVVADVAHAPELAELTGAFIRVRQDRRTLDLTGQCGATHYLGTRGVLMVHWTDGLATFSKRMRVDDSVWIAPYVAHGFSGDGAVLMLGERSVLTDGCEIELARAFDAAGTVKRACAESENWGHDE